jgi:hypothetical protein
MLRARAPDPAAPHGTTLGRVTIHLRRTEENAAAIDAAADRLGARVGIEGVLAHLNRQAVRARVPGRAVDWGLSWNDADVETRKWWPQGFTTSADAGPGHPREDDDRRILVTSWYAKTAGGRNLGSRISVLDLDSLAYRHVLLVEATQAEYGKPALRPLLVHAGGLVWCGPYLHVAGTRRGLLSCRVEDVIRVDSTDDALGYRYVLPVRFGYDARAEEGTEQMRYSFLSLDRGADPPALVAGEYGRDEMTRRLVRYPLDPHTGHLSAHEDGASRPARLDEEGLGHMQGAVVVDGTYYVTASRGPRTAGLLHVGRPGNWRTVRRALPPGPEDITYWPATDTLWSLSEHPGKRYVFSMRRSTI